VKAQASVVTCCDVDVSANHFFSPFDMLPYSRILPLLPCLVVCLTSAISATPQVLLDAAKGQVRGMVPPPVMVKEEGVPAWRGPSEWKISPREGIFTVTFRFLGFESGRQEDLMILHSGDSTPVAVVRNVNSSARLKTTGRHLISGPGGRYRIGQWHDVKMVYHSGKGTLDVTCDGQLKLQDSVTQTGTRFGGLSFAKSAALSGLRVTYEALPVASPEEKRLRARRAALAAKIEGFPTNTRETSRQRAVLQYHLDQLDQALLQDALAEGGEIASDIEVGLSRPMGRMVAKQVWLRPVFQQANNPWLDATFLHQWVNEWSKKNDRDWKVSTAKNQVYESIHGARGTRDQGQAANQWMLLYAHPASPLRDRDELLIRSMRCVDAYLRDYHFHETLEENSHLNDFFALGPALMGAVMIQRTYPDLLLPKQSAIWQAAAAKAAKRYYLMKGHGNYSNADLGHARIFIASALFTGNRADLAHGIKLALSWGDNIFPDGATSYIAKQNESQGYHGACIDIQIDNWLMTHDPAMLETIRRTEWYPLSVNDGNRIGEWFTVPSWKQSWYGAKAYSGHAAVWYLTGNPWYAALGEPDRFDRVTQPSMKLAMLYRKHVVKPRALPQRFAFYDRNILGARISNGRWTSAMNGRVTDQLIGKNTYVGLTIAEADGQPEPALNAALYGIMMYPVFPGQGTNTPTEETVSVAMGQQVAALGAHYRLARRMAGPSRRPLPWQGRQCWLMLPDRMIGYLELTPDDKASAHGISLHLEIGRAKAGARRKEGIRKFSDRLHGYGDLRVRVLDTSLGPVLTRDASDGLAADGVRGPHAEYHLVDAASAKGWSAKPTVRPQTEHALIELRMDGSPDAQRIEKIKDGKLIGISATFARSTILSLYNSGTTSLEVETARFALKGRTSLIGHRPDFKLTSPVPEKLTLPAGESAILVLGESPQLHRAPIIGIQSMLESANGTGKSQE
jgi:hypothetical protein